MDTHQALRIEPNHPRHSSKASEADDLSVASLPRVGHPLRGDSIFDFVTGGQVIVVGEEQMLALYPLCRQGRCRIRLFDHSAGDGRVVVLATDLDKGVSVTNAVEDIAAQVCLRYRLHPDQVTFIEHYDDRAKNIHPRAGLRRTNGESFDLVNFPERKDYHFGTPHWRPTTKSEVESLIGGELP